jgi:hypothetical protein
MYRRTRCGRRGTGADDQGQAPQLTARLRDLPDFLKINDLVAEDAVYREPFSGPNSLPAGNFAANRRLCGRAQ